MKFRSADIISLAILQSLFLLSCPKMINSAPNCVITTVLTIMSFCPFLDTYFGPRFSLYFTAMDFPGHFEQIFQQLNYQRVHGQLWDCVIVVGSRHFKAHRSVLAACSTHFRALFTVAEGDTSMNMIQLDSEVSVLRYFHNNPI